MLIYIIFRTVTQAVLPIVIARYKENKKLREDFIDEDKQLQYLNLHHEARCDMHEVLN